MKHRWRLSEQPAFLQIAPQWGEPVVLLEYEGPQLVVIEDKGKKLLGVAADETDGALRWIFAGMQDMEYEALLGRATSLRSVFEKNLLTVVDYAIADMVPLAVWEARADEIPDSALPEPGVLLPVAIAESVASVTAEAEQPSFSLSALDHVSFDVLSAVTQSIQSLWNALSQNMYGQLATLSATAFEHGSLKIGVMTDDLGLFEKIALQYRDLAIATDDGKRLNGLLNEAPAPVITAYREYVNTIADTHTDVFARWGTGAAYLRSGLAANARKAIRETPQDQPATQARTVNPVGNFLGYWPSKRVARFMFFDSATGLVVEGKIDDPLRLRMVQDPSVSLSKSHLYRTSILMVVRGDEVSYTLQDFEEIQPKS